MARNEKREMEATIAGYRSFGKAKRVWAYGGGPSSVDSQGFFTRKWVEPSQERVMSAGMWGQPKPRAESVPVLKPNYYVINPKDGAGHAGLSATVHPLAPKTRQQAGAFAKPVAFGGNFRDTQAALDYTKKTGIPVITHPIPFTRGKQGRLVGPQGQEFGSMAFFTTGYEGHGYSPRVAASMGSSGQTRTGKIQAGPELGAPESSGYGLYAKQQRERAARAEGGSTDAETARLEQQAEQTRRELAAGQTEQATVPQQPSARPEAPSAIYSKYGYERRGRRNSPFRKTQFSSLGGFGGIPMFPFSNY